MSDLTKNSTTLHVHFDDDVAVDATPKSQSNNENGRQADAIEKNGTATLNYSRDDLLKLRNCSMAKFPPRFTDADHIDDKRKEKIRMVFKLNGGTNNSALNKRTTLSATSATDSKKKMALTENISLLPSFALGKCRKNEPNTVDTVVDGNCNGNDKDANATIAANNENLPNEKDRMGFQQLMASASGPNVVNSFVEHNESQTNSRRQRVGSGRIAENAYSGGGLWSNGYRHNDTGNGKDIAFHLNYGIDYRYSNNEFFDKRPTVMPVVVPNNGDRNNKVVGERDAYEWNKENNRFPQVSMREGSSEPEWVSCGPTSKHDIIELHGFDGPNAGADDKLTTTTTAANSPPARSTPAKAKKNNEMPVKSHEHFSFEDFFKLDLPSGNHIAKSNASNGESRFTQFFRRNSPPKKSGNNVFDANMRVHGSGQQSCTSSEQFIDLLQKSHDKKIASNLTASSAKFRSVEELEAELVAPTAAGHAQQMYHQRQQQTKAANELIEFEKLLNQMARQQQQYALQQQQQQQQQQMTNNAHIVRQLCLLQQMNNTSFHQRERERDALNSLLSICAPQQQQPQQHQQFMQKANVAQNFHRFQANIANGMPSHPPTPQELQYHTQAIMQNALLNKQYEDQYRKSQQYQKQHQQGSPMTQSPLPMYHNNQNYGQQQFRMNNKPPKFNQLPKDGFQLMPPPQSKPIFGRSSGTSQRAGHANPMKFQNTSLQTPNATAAVQPAVADTNLVDTVPHLSPAISIDADK